MRLPPPDCGLTRFDLVALAEGHVQPAPELLRRTDGQALLYAGAVHAVSGAPGCGKSWLALAGVVQIVASGGHAVICDYEDTAATTASRLLALGTEPDALARVAYVQIAGPVADTGRSWLLDVVERVGVRLVVIDSVAEALAAEGCSENDAVEVSSWMARLPRPLARAGAAVLLVDHVTKDESSRGRWARGSGAKLAAIDGAAYLLDVDLPFSRTTLGAGTLRLAKDRHGAIGQVGLAVARVRFEVTGGSLHEVILDPPDHDGDGALDPHGRLRPADVADRLEASGRQWSSLTVASQALGMSRQAATAVLDEAVHAGVIVEEPGNRGARRFRLPDTDRARGAPNLTLLTDHTTDGRVWEESASEQGPGP